MINHTADEQWYENWAVRHADNLTRCSCHMCGNPRKHFNDITIQEKKWQATYDLTAE
jgi:hypothetical protein